MWHAFKMDGKNDGTSGDDDGYDVTGCHGAVTSVIVVVEVGVVGANCNRIV